MWRKCSQQAQVKKMKYLTSRLYVLNSIVPMKWSHWIKFLKVLLKKNWFSFQRYSSKYRIILPLSLKLSIDYSNSILFPLAGFLLMLKASVPWDNIVFGYITKISISSNQCILMISFHFIRLNMTLIALWCRENQKILSMGRLPTKIQYGLYC